MNTIAEPVLIPVRSKRSAARLLPFSYNGQWAILTAILVLMDAFMIWSSLTLAYSLRITSGLMAYYGLHDPRTYSVLVLISAPIWLVLFATFGLYRRDTLLGGTGEYQQVAKACTTGIFVIIVISFFWRDLVLVSRGWLFLSLAFSCAMVWLGRFAVRHTAFNLRRKGWLTARVLIIGANEQGVMIANQWNHSTNSGLRVLGFVDDFKPLGTPVLDNLEVIGRPTNLQELIGQHKIDEVVLLPNAVARETFEEIIAQANTPKSYVLRLSPGFYELLTSSVVATNKTFVPLFTINEARIVGLDAVMKRAIDYIFGLPLCLASLTLSIPIALAMKLTRPHQPVLAPYRTIGLGGTYFSMYTFNIASTASCLADDAGASWMQRLLSRTGLYKLPQLLSVLSGHMSLVGPHPRTVGAHETDPATLYHLQSVKPGFIGPWMVSEIWSSSDETQDELYYVRNWTIWLDVQIILEVAGQMIFLSRVRPSEADPKSNSAKPNVVRQVSQEQFKELQQQIAPALRATPSTKEK